MEEEQIVQIPREYAGKRLDQILPLLFSDYSRSLLQKWIKEGRVELDGRPPKGSQKVVGDEVLALNAVWEEHSACLAQDIALDLLFEDDHLLVVNKPAGLVVHPAAGNPDGTLQNGLLFHDEKLAALPRAGIVHRLDKDTTGAMVVAKSLASHKNLVDALQKRQIKRQYQAIIVGLPVAGATIDEPIGRHPSQRTKMAVVASGKPARTHFMVVERFFAHSRLDIELESGRTHQIRVHLAHLGWPIVGDSVYGGRLRLPAALGEAARSVLRQFNRQALHAYRLSLDHPISGERLEFTAQFPQDWLNLVSQLRLDAQNHRD